MLRTPYIAVRPPVVALPIEMQVSRPGYPPRADHDWLRRAGGNVEEPKGPAPSRLLLVGGSGESTAVTAELLARAGYALRRALCVAEADEGLLDGPDAIVLDEAMVDRPAHEACRLLRDNPAGIPLLHLLPVELPHACANAVPAADHLTRPVAEDALLALLSARIALRRAREALDRSERLHASLLDGITEAFFAVDLDARILYANPRAMAFARRSVAELRGSSIWDMFPAALDLEFHQQYVRARRDGRPVRFESYYPPFDGWYEVRGYPGRDGMAILINDVTERRRAEQERERLLHEAQEARREAERAEGRVAFLAQASVALSETLDFDATLQRVAELAVPALADFCAVEATGSARAGSRHAVKHRDPAVTERVRSLPWPVLQGADADAAARIALCGSAEGPFAVRPGEGSSPLSLSQALVVPLSAHGRVLGTVYLGGAVGRPLAEDDPVIAEELARRAALALENARLYEETQRAARAREELMAVVSHDLKNPVAAVLLSAGMIERHAPSGKVGERVRVAADNIKRSCERMRRLIGDLLDMARIEANHLAVDLADQDGCAMLDEALELHLPLAVRKRIRLERECRTDAIRVSCDRHRVLQVLSNLLGNAIQHTPEGGAVTLDAQADGAEARFSIRDQGPGIHPDQMPHLFERFWQAKEPAREGAGLGLYIARGIVRAHGGRIWAESAPSGSTFHFTLPRSECPLPSS